MRIHLVNDCSIGQNNFESHAVGVHGALFDKFDTSCVGSKVATDLAGALGAKVQRHHVPQILGVVLEGLEDSSSLTGQNTLGFIEAENLIHFLRANNNLVMKWNRATDEASVAALRHHSDLPLVAVLEALRDLLSGARGQHDGPNANVFVGEITNKWVDLVDIGDDVFRAYYLGELLEI